MQNNLNHKLCMTAADDITPCDWLNWWNGVMGGPLQQMRAGLLSSPALRGTMRDVASDERASVGFDINAASAEQLLAMVYPGCTPCTTQPVTGAAGPRRQARH